MHNALLLICGIQSATFALCAEGEAEALRSSSTINEATPIAVGEKHEHQIPHS